MGSAYDITLKGNMLPDSVFELRMHVECIDCYAQSDAYVVDSEDASFMLALFADNGECTCVPQSLIWSDIVECHPSMWNCWFAGDVGHEGCWNVGELEELGLKVSTVYVA